MGLLDGKVAVITGAGGGLGRAYALLFAKEGCKVVVNDLGGTRDGTGGGEAMADEVVAEIEAAGGEAIANYASVADPEGAQSMVDAAVDTWGRLDIVVNNAGILRDRTLLKLDVDHFDLVLAVHARGTYLVGKAGAEAMKQCGNGGSIINTSSIAGLKGNFGQTNYACAKAGIAGMTRVWAQELVRYDIRTNAIAPMAKTRMTEDISAVPDDVTPEQIAPVALFLASDLSSDVNGRIFGAHGPHVFEYHMKLSPGVEIEGTWTASQLAERLDEIAALPEAAPAKADSGGEDIGAMVDEVFAGMPELFLPERAGDWSTVIHFDIKGTGSYGVVVEGGVCRSSKGKPDGIRCNITYDSAETLLGTITGKINPQQAFMGGKVKADNMGDLMKFAQCFDMKKGQAMARARGGGQAAGPAEQIGQVFERMPELFLPERAASWTSVIHFHIKGTGSWGVTVQDGTCTSSKGQPGGAKCNITYDSADTFLGTITGKVNPQQAFMSGKVTADNMGDLMKFAQCFDMKKGMEMARADKGAAAAPSGMSRATIGRTYRTKAEFIRREHLEAYARACNDDNPAYVGEGDIVAHPIFPVRPLMHAVGEAVMDPELNADLMRLVHGEQDMRFYDALRPWDLVAARATVLGIEDKSSGQLIKVRQRLMRDGDPVCEVVSGYFVRGKSKKKKDAAAASPAPEAPPARDYVWEATYTVDDDQSYRYAKASLDENPIHVDESAAKAAGHPSVILHGLCTMALTTREVVNRACDGDPTRLRRIAVRFTRIVLPGDQLTTRAWIDGHGEGVTHLGLETTNQRGEVVLGNALAEVSGM